MYRPALNIVKYLIGIFFLVSAVNAFSTPILYDIEFDPLSGPDGTGSFSFDDCADVVVCPEFLFESSFGSGLDFSTIQLGGNAIFLNDFFLGLLTELPQGTNFDSDDEFRFLLSFETTGVYCIRDFVGASGLCEEDPGVFAIGTWSVSRSVPEPSNLALFGIGLFALGYMRQKQAAN